MGREMRKELFKIQGVVMTDDKIEVNGNIIQIPRDQLKEIAPKYVGLPITAGHRGRKIGVVESSRYEDGKIFILASIFEPRNKEEHEAIEKMKTGEHSALSPSYTYTLKHPERKSGVIHGDTVVLGENEDGSLILGLKMSLEDIESAFGNTENIDQILFDKFWLHNGSDEAKEYVEKEYKKNKQKVR